MVALLVAVARRGPSARDALDDALGAGFTDKLDASARDLPVTGSGDSVAGVLDKTDCDDLVALGTAVAAEQPDLVKAILSGPAAGASPALGTQQAQDLGSELVGQEAAQSRPEPNADKGSGFLEDRIDYAKLGERLRERVRGQDGAVDTVVRRLAVTRAQMDLRPERPDGVFLFVGPTGVGKTGLAVALAGELMNDEGAMIRLDMSEYAHDWALSRLTGPMPGYVGSNEPESWLTTKVARRPRSVILLDEVEKAHPAVWNIFLQAFDAGRLTDSSGKTADFSQTIVVMTSNIGADVFTKAPVGFSRDDDLAEDEVTEREGRTVKASVNSFLPPELVNRLDAIITFQALPPDCIAEIAEVELDRLCDRMKERNLNLEISSEATKLIAESNYDRKFGARHLHRNIELMLIEPLALSGIETGTVQVTVSEGSIEVRQD